MKYLINEKGFNFIETRLKVARFQAVVYFPVTAFGGIAIMLYILEFNIITIICCLFVLAFDLFWLIYKPLVEAGRLFNSVIIDIEFNDQEYIYHTAKTFLYPSKEVKGTIANLKRGNSDEFNNYAQKLIIQSGNDSSTIAFILKDFYDNYDAIAEKIPVCQTDIPHWLLPLDWRVAQNNQNRSADDLTEIK